MKIDEIADFLGEDIVETIKKFDGIIELNDPQRKAVNAGLFADVSMVVAAPTASGKTLIAEMAAIHEIRNRGKKVVYVVPLRSIGSEKYREFKQKYGDLNIKVALSMGDYDSDDPWLKYCDLIIATSEKLESLLRHNVEWIREVGLLIVDEVHLLNDVGRGPTLEVVMTKLREMIPTLRVLALSATISNAEEIASWLDAKLVTSNYRPVPVKKAVFCGGALLYENGEMEKLAGVSDADGMLIYFANRNKQLLVFVNSRRNAENMAAKLSGKVLIKRQEKDFLNSLASEVLSALDTPTEQCRKLASCVKNGVAFHHAGLVQKQRELLENGFRKGLIKIMVATPTLAAGVNLPASVVVVKHLSRFESGEGAQYIPVLEFQQMIGRSGRPKYDKEGLAIAVARNEREAENIMERYIKGKPEPVYSKLAVEPVLRVHLLGLIASVHFTTFAQIMDFISKTFYAFQYRELNEIRAKVRRIVDMLEAFELVEVETGGESGDIAGGLFFRASDSGKDLKIRATKLGKRVSELYIDPMSAHLLVSGLRRENIRNADEVSFFHLIALTTEFRPLPSVSRKEEEKLLLMLEEYEEKLLVELPPLWSFEIATHMRAMKAALVLKSWIDEEKEDVISSKFGVAPGDLRVMIENAEWLLYSTEEVGRVINADVFVLNRIERLRKRVVHGVKEDILELVLLPGIGRVKARKLYNAGIRSIKDIGRISMAVLESLVGVKTAEKVLKALQEMKEQSK